MRNLSKHLSLAVLLLCAASRVGAQPPIVQTACTPDPAPYVYDDTVWIFTGHDLDTATYFRMPDWQLYSTRDMVNYTYHGTPMTTATFAWARQGDNAWASQAVCRNGKWYWYVAAEDMTNHLHGIGVAVADRPEGPYTDPIEKPLVPGDWGFIDPTVFIDNDGSAWLFWGNNGLWYAELGDDMVSLKDGFRAINVDDSTAFGPRVMKRDYKLNKMMLKTGFEEAPWVYRIGDTYYMEYAAGGVPEHWAYSTAPTIHGPWTYRGRVMAESPQSFTIHGGSISYHGRDFMFYHNGRLPYGGGFRRSAAVEEFRRNADGSLPFIPFTDRGVVTPVRTLNPFQRVEAETMADSRGLQTDRTQGTEHYITAIDDGDWQLIRAVAIDRPARRFVARVRSDKGGTIELHVGSKETSAVAVLQVKPTRGAWKTVRAKVNTCSLPFGTHDLYLIYKGTGENLFDVDWWQLVR